VIREARAEDLPAVATMVARRHERSFAAKNLLNPSFEDPDTVLASLPAQPTGWVAEVDGQVVASLLWEVDDTRTVCHLAGTVGDPEWISEIYAQAAGVWVSSGFTTHTIIVPTVDRGMSDRLVDLSFGRQQAYAVRPLGDQGGEPVEADGVTLEKVGTDAVDEVVPLGDVVARYHEGPPVFDRRSNEFYRGLPATYRHALEEGSHLVLARLDGVPRGLLLWRPGPPRPVYAPESAEIRLLAVHPEVQGRRIGQSLTSYALREMVSLGHSACVVDWRTTNLSASRFWPGLGFLTIAHRYAREITLVPYDDIDD
jgi:GNAT superfamily N-acetyltransferase